MLRVAMVAAERAGPTILTAMVRVTHARLTADIRALLVIRAADIVVADMDAAVDINWSL
jgi:hypothetical protein